VAAAVELPPALAQGSGGEVVREADDLFAEHAVATRLRRGGGGFQVELAPETAIAAPAVLVYWSPAAATEKELPAEAFLLGSLAGTRARAFDLPAAALGRDGWLVLYSLGHQQVLDAAALAAVGEAVEESR
jgi:hypothetical protein